MSSERTLVRFDELCDIKRGASPRPIQDWMAPTGIPWVKISDATASKTRFIDSTAEFIKEEGGRYSVAVHPGDFILSNSATPGLPKVMRINACIHDGWLLLRNFRRITKEYCYYLLLNERPKLVARGNGSVFTNLKTDILKSHVVEIPTLVEQAQVTDVLLALDNRIDLLRHTNATLESIAQALFKSWFVDFDPVRAKAEGREPEGMDAATAALFPAEFEESTLGSIPKGWEVARLDDILELAYGKALKSTDRRPGCVPVYGSGGITGYHDEALVNHPSVIVGRKGTVGALYWEDRPFFPIDTTFYVKPRTAPLTFCFYGMQRLGLENMNTDAAVPGLNRENAYRLQLIRSTDAVLKEFDVLVAALRDGIRANSQRAETLAALRDSLLPRLISGKLRVTEAQAELEEVIL